MADLVAAPEVLGFLNGLRSRSTNPTLLRAITEVEAELQPDPDPPCRVYSHDTDGWHCAVTGDHDQHTNAAGDVTW